MFWLRRQSLPRFSEFRDQLIHKQPDAVSNFSLLLRTSPHGIWKNRLQDPDRCLRKSVLAQIDDQIVGGEFGDDDFLRLYVRDRNAFLAHQSPRRSGVMAARRQTGAARLNQTAPSSLGESFRHPAPIRVSQANEEHSDRSLFESMSKSHHLLRSWAFIDEPSIPQMSYSPWNSKGVASPCVQWRLMKVMS